VSLIDSSGRNSIGSTRDAAPRRRSLRETQAFAGVLAVLPTAFGDDGRLDPDGIAALVAVNRAAGVAGIVVLGVMGEAAELSEAERRQVIEIVKARSGELPIVLGISAESAADVARRAQDGAALGVTAVMVSPAPAVPLAEAVRAASTAALPIVIQDYPAGSGVSITVDEIASAADAVPLVAGVKVEAPPTAGKVAALHDRLPSLPTFGGLGGLFLVDELRAGAAGTMTGFALPERLVEIVREFADAPSDAELRWQRLLPLMRFEAFPPLSLAARKEVWRLRGIIRSARCRRAGAVLDERTRDDVRKAFEAVVARAGV
jgi:4-hydroxy-tetrahydrodipicolinate synthase